MKNTRIPMIALVVIATAAATALASSFITSSTPAPTPVPEADGSAAVQVGDRVVTVSEIDARWRTDHPAEYMAAMQALYDGRRKTVEAVVSDLVVESAAAKRGLEPAQFLALEMTQRVAAVKDEEVIAVHAENAEALGAGPVAEQRARIREALEERERRRAHHALVADLVVASGSDVGVFLDAPRQVTPVSDTDPSLGSADAAVTIVTYSDFQCPFCARVEPTLKALHKNYGDRLRIVWKDFPLTSIHPDAFKAAEAGHCAAAQGRYWAFHDRVFAHQQQLGVDALLAHAAAVGIERTDFEQCLKSGRFETRVQDGLESGRRLGVEATPTLFVNGRTVSGAQPMEVLVRVIDEELDRAGVRR